MRAQPPGLPPAAPAQKALSPGFRADGAMAYGSGGVEDRGDAQAVVQVVADLATVAELSEKARLPALLPPGSAVLTSLQALADGHLRYLHLLDEHHLAATVAAAEVDGEIAELCRLLGIELSGAAAHLSEAEEPAHDSAALARVERSAAFVNLTLLQPTRKPALIADKQGFNQSSLRSPSLLEDIDEEAPLQLKAAAEPPLSIINEEAVAHGVHVTVRDVFGGEGLPGLPATLSPVKGDNGSPSVRSSVASSCLQVPVPGSEDRTTAPKPRSDRASNEDSETSEPHMDPARSLGTSSVLSFFWKPPLKESAPDPSAQRRDPNQSFSTLFDTSLLESRKRRKKIESTPSQQRLIRDRQPLLQRWAAWVMNLPCFNVVSAAVILFNMVIIGMEADHFAKDGRASETILHIEIGITIWYALELAVRVCAAGRQVFTNNDRRWNLFDLMLLFVAIADITAHAALLEGRQVESVHTKALRILRVLKVVRALRMGRMLRNVAELHKMVYSLASSMQTLFWAMVLLSGVTFAFGVALAEGVADLDSQCPAETMSTLEDYFGGLPLTIYYLYLSISGGVTYGDITNPLLRCSLALPITYLAYISITVFGVLNIVLSVFVESAMQSINRSRELMIRDREQNKANFIAHMEQIFREIDTDGSGRLSHAELAAFLSDHDHPLHNYFDALDLESLDVDALFQLLDEDKGGSVDIDEFCNGCLNLKGNAKAYDIKVLQYEMLNIQKSLSLFMSQVGRKLHLEGADAVSLACRSQRPSFVRPSLRSVLEWEGLK